MSLFDAVEPVVEVLKPGLASTVQDGGRPNRASIALSRGGAMDRAAMALANALVGNAPDAAGIEVTGPGPTLHFRCDAWIASVGAQHALDAGEHGSGDSDAIPTHRPVFVPAGTVVRWNPPERGWRSWIAIAGGLALPEVLGARSAHLAARLGPPRLVAGDRLPLAEDAATIARARADATLRGDRRASGRGWPSWRVADRVPRAWPLVEVPALAGRHLDALAPQARRALVERRWTVAAQSNRQGMRLSGEPVDTRTLPQLASEPVDFGTVQLPPAGEPVILLAEHQTTGGYARVLEAASAAERVLAQAAPGCTLRFRPIDLDEADRLAIDSMRDDGQRLEAVRAACRAPG